MQKEKPKRTNNPLAMRARILDVAAALFQQNGYNGTSIQDVVQAAATTGGALHHHFATKKALGLAVIAERVAAEVQETAIKPVSTAASVGEGVATFLDNVATTLDRNQVVSGCPLNNLALELSLADSDFRQAVSTVFDKWREAIVVRLKTDRPAMSASDAQDLATLVVASYSGAMAMAKASQSAEPLRASARQLALVLA